MPPQTPYQDSAGIHRGHDKTFPGVERLSVKVQEALLSLVNDPRAEPLKTVRKGEPFVIMGELCKADRIPDSPGWGSFEFSSADDSNSTASVYHMGMGPVYAPAVLNLCAGKPLPSSPAEAVPA